MCAYVIVYGLPGSIALLSILDTLLLRVIVDTNFSTVTHRQMEQAEGRMFVLGVGAVGDAVAQILFADA